jgi:hypothetical protein
MKVSSWHRRQALMLASQLPDREDARIILGLMQDLVEDFLQEPDAIPRPASVVLLKREGEA